MLSCICFLSFFVSLVFSSRMYTLLWYYNNCNSITVVGFIYIHIGYTWFSPTILKTHWPYICLYLIAVVFSDHFIYTLALHMLVCDSNSFLRPLYIHVGLYLFVSDSNSFLRPLYIHVGLYLFVSDISGFRGPLYIHIGPIW